MLTREQDEKAFAPSFVSHAHCSALSLVFRGQFCAELSRQAGRRVKAGETVYAEGDRAQSVYFLKQGLVKTSVITAHGEEVVLELHPAGDVFGELCFCGRERREQAVTLEPSEIVEISSATLFAQLQRSPQALTAFLGVVCQRLADAYDRLGMLSFDDTMARLARTLIKLGTQLGRPAVGGVEIPHYLRQEDLAEMIGASREVVSSLLNRLRHLHLIEYRRKGQLFIRMAPLLGFLERAAPRDHD